MLTILLHEWLPAMVDGVPRSQVIGELVPNGARWWVAFGPLPIIAGVWAYEAWRLGGFGHIGEFLADDTPPKSPPNRLLRPTEFRGRLFPGVELVGQHREGEQTDRHVQERAEAMGGEVDERVEEREDQRSIAQPTQRPDGVGVAAPADHCGDGESGCQCRAARRTTDAAFIASSSNVMSWSW